MLSVKGRLRGFSWFFGFLSELRPFPNHQYAAQFPLLSYFKNLLLNLAFTSILFAGDFCIFKFENRRKLEKLIINNQYILKYVNNLYSLPSVIRILLHYSPKRSIINGGIANNRSRKMGLEMKRKWIILKQMRLL